MTDRQLAAQVRYGRLVTFETPELQESSVTGYVAGFDQDNIRLAVVRTEGQRRWIENIAVNRSYIGKIQFHSKTTMTQEPCAAELEQLVRRFRDWVIEQYFPESRRR